MKLEPSKADPKASHQMRFLRNEPWPLPDIARRIRDLVSVARGSIIEIGRELIAAKAEQAPGEWLPWLDAEFGWSERTAYKYIAVAQSFAPVANDSATVEHFSSLTIDATALFTLSDPDVPQEARDEAVGRAEAGERITKKQAEQMVREAKALKAQEMEDAFRAATEKYQKSEQRRINKAIKEATAELRDDKAELAARIKALKAELNGPIDIDALAKILCRALGIRSLSSSHWQLMAQLLGHGIAVGNKTYAPTSPEEIKRQEEALRLAASVTEAMQSLAGAPPPRELLAGCYPVQRALIREKLDTIADWIEQCRQALDEYDPLERV